MLLTSSSDGSNSTGNQTNNVTSKTLNYDDLTNLLGELKIMFFMIRCSQILIHIYFIVSMETKGRK